MAHAQDGPVALVTGGAGGIGTAICRQLATQGYRLVVVDYDVAGAKQVEQSVGGSAFEADVSDPEHNRAMVAHAIAEFGRLDLVVLNAGVSSGQSPGDPLSLELYRRTTGVNLDGVVFGIDAAVPVLSRDGGAIVVMASLAALGPEDANPVYALTKCAVLGYVRAIAGTLAEHRVRVNAICPGFVDTAILGIGRKLLRKQKFPLLSPDEVAEAVMTVLDQAGTGEAWTIIAGRPPDRFAFPTLPITLMPDGSEAKLRPFLAPRTN